MNAELLKMHIDNFMARLNANPALKEKDIDERRERIFYYRSWTAERIASMTEDDVLEYMSNLWAMLIWGNKQYYVDKLINDNGLLKFKEELSSLVWGLDGIEKRWDRFRAEIKGMGPAMISEILCHVHPDLYMIWNRRAKVGLHHLEVKNLPKYDYQINGKVYKRFCDVYAQIAEALKKHGFEDTTLLSVDYFIWDELQVLDNLSNVNALIESSNAQPVIVNNDVDTITDEEKNFIHNDVRDALRDIGNFLGFDASIERKVADGAVVDTIWESKIGNMGRVIYVFEVQKSGSIDSLLLNLLRSLNNPAVQGIVAVGDRKMLEQIQREASNIPNIKDRLRYWNYEEILDVRDSLQLVNDSIGKLKLVPEGFK